MFAAAGGVLLLALIVGLWLSERGGWPILVLGVVSLICALAYTGGPFPLAHHGLGDLFVFLFFGLFAVLGTAWVQVAPVLAKVWGVPFAFDARMLTSDHWWLRLPLEWWAVAAAIGCQATAIICVNNLRDIASDARVGKRTLAVRLGERGTRIYFGCLHLAATAGWMAAASWRPWLLIPAGIAAFGGAWLTLGIARSTGVALNGYLARSAALELVTGLSAAALLAMV
jgi:1,4-dihydroxy-2-naphthoate octaprenyltransferase